MEGSSVSVYVHADEFAGNSGCKHGLRFELDDLFRTASAMRLPHFASGDCARLRTPQARWLRVAAAAMV
jgi:hypothetical protein